MNRWRIAALFGLAMIASCTIYALSDDIHQEKCDWKFGAYDACEGLNDRSDPNFNRCKFWRCGDDNFCELAPTDVDHDGFTPPGCITTGQPGDCADDDPDVWPGAEEVCDGKDNDCDGIIDEGMLQIDQRVAMSFAQAVSELGFASDEMRHDVAVVARDATDDTVSFGTVTRAQPAPTPRTVWASAGIGELHASAVSVASSPAGAFVLSVTEAAPTHRLWVGRVTSGASRASLSVDEPNLRQTGLRCANDEACAALQGPPRMEAPPDDMTPAPPPGPPPNIPESTRAEIAVLGTKVLAGYARRLDPAADGCNVTEPAPPLLLNLLELGGAGFAEISPAAIRLDSSSELRSPRIVPIETFGGTSSLDPFGWLVAYLDSAGGLVFRRVRPQAEDPLAELRLRLQPDAEPYLEARIAGGAVEVDRVLIGVAARAGCGDRARIVFGLLQVTWDDTGRSELRVYRELHEIGDVDQQASSPMLAYNRTQSIWAVAYAAPDGIYARVLDRNGQPVGGGAYRLTEKLPPVPDMAIIEGAPGEAELFTIYSYAEQPDRSPTHVLLAAGLRTCPR